MIRIAFGLGLAGLLVTTAAMADDSDYCTKVQARAHADSFLLFSPSAQLIGIKYPAGAPGVVAVGGSTSSDGYQVRAALSWSPLDAYKGTQVLTLADKDCLQHSATVDAQNLLEQMNDVGRSAALQAEITYLNDKSDVVKSIISDTQKRLSIGSLTIIDLSTIQTAADTIQRKFAVSQGQLDIVRAKDYIVAPRSASEIAERLKKYSMEFEEQTSKVRMLDPWTVAFNGGAVPPMTQGDNVAWFGMIQLNYNFGGLVRGHYENEYLSSRQNELKRARYELSDQIKRLQDGVKAGIASS